MRKEQLRSYKSKRDVNIKTQRKLLSEDEIAKIRQKRARQTARAKKADLREKEISQNKRNINVLTAKQKAARNRRVKRIQAKRDKLLYKKTGGDIAFRDILTGVKWQDNFTSSNVWKFARRANNLMIQFLDGSIYLYFNVAKQFLGLFNAGSKGK